MKNFAIFHPKSHRYYAFGWLICCLLLLASLGWLLPRAQINSSVMALLPKEQVAGVPDGILNGFNQRLDRQMVWLVSSGKSEDPAVAKWWFEEVKKLPEMDSISGQIDTNQQKIWGKFFFDYRVALLSEDTQARLKQGADVQSAWVLSQLYSPFAGVSAKELQHDPLLLIRAYQQSQQQGAGSFSLMNGWLSSRDADGRVWFLLHGELKQASSNMASAHQSVAKLNALEQQMKEKWPDSKLMQRGTLFYSDYASEQAEKDISTIGVVSGLGIFLLLFLVFRSVKPLGLTLLSLCVGVLTGTVATLFVFGEVHIMTLVMSTSVVGISIDYALHYLTERLVHGDEESPLDSLRKLFPILLLAVVTSSMAYLILLFAPFPGLQQLAVFAASGLFGAFLTVVCWYPKLSQNLPTQKIKSLPLLQRWIDGWLYQPKVRWGIPLLFLVFILIGIPFIHINDDIKSLQSLPASLQQQEQKIASLTGQHGDQKWFLVYGDTPEETLQRLENLQPKLLEAKEKGDLEGFRLLPLPSLKRQQENIDLFQAASPSVIKNLQAADLAVTEPEVSKTLLKPDVWVKSPTSDGWRLLWLSLEDGKSAVLVPVSGVTNPQALNQLAQNSAGVHWVDRHTEFNQLFSVYRHYLSVLLVVALSVISLMFLYKFKFRQGIRCIVPTLLSVGAGLALLGFTGQPLNLFSLLALILVIGIGMDYTLFFSNPNGTPATSCLSIVMAALTTQLTFGLLALSHTQAIAGFGMVLTGGILTAFVLSPLALPLKNSKHKDVNDAHH